MTRNRTYRLILPFFTLLSVIILSCGDSVTTSDSQFVTDDLNEDVEEIDSSLEEEEEALAPSSDSSCTPELGFWRPGGTYNDPTELITDTAVECCDICRAKPRCITWSRERASGACALKDRRSPLVPNEDYDSGFPATTRAQETATLTGCFVERGIRYTNGIVLRRTRTRNARACCEECRQDVNCFSWYRNGRTRRCVLNRNVPQQQTVSRSFTGSALI